MFSVKHENSCSIKISSLQTVFPKERLNTISRLNETWN